MPHRRARRCSLSAAVASFVTRSRSHCPLSAILESREVDHAVALQQRELYEWTAVAGPAEAAAARRLIECAVGRAYQIAPVAIEEYALLPVELHRHVRAAIEVAVHAPAVADGERRRRPPEVVDLEAHAAPRLGKLARAADQALRVSHACKIGR